jgi:hypothetical protein
MEITPNFDSDEMQGNDGPYPLDRIDDEDPQGRTWRETRLTLLFATLQVIRDETGAPISITAHGGYRSEAHQQRIVDSHPDDREAGLVASATTSQHPKGRAADVQSAKLSVVQLHAFILRLYQTGRLPYLGGLGLYPNFCHIDVRPRVPTGESAGAALVIAVGHLAQWSGSRTANVA